MTSIWLPLAFAAQLGFHVGAELGDGGFEVGDKSAAAPRLALSRAAGMTVVHSLLSMKRAASSSLG